MLFYRALIFLILQLFSLSLYAGGFDCPVAAKNGKGSDWTPANREAIQSFLNSPPAPLLLRKRGEEELDSRARVATFDWDNTIIYGDVGDATLKYLIDTRGFSFDENFWSLIPAAVRPRLRKLYEESQKPCPKMGRDSPSPLRERDGERAGESCPFLARQKFSKLFWQTYENMCAKQGDRACYTWAVQLMTGLGVNQVREVARTVIKNFSKQGPCYYPQMKKLLKRLQKAGVDVWVVSASTQWIVEEAAKPIGIDADHVIGMLPKLDDEGKVTPVMERVTYREGKAKAIRQIIGHDPDFAAGDSNTDIEMLLMGKGPRLVIDRGKEPLMGIARQRGWLVQPRFYIP